MSLNSSKEPVQRAEEIVSVTPATLATPSPSDAPPSQKTPMKWRIFYIIGLPVWVFLGFMLAQALILALVEGLVALKVPLGSISPIVFNAAGGAIIYALAILLVLGVPWLVKKRRTTRHELGLQRLPSWLDIASTPVGVIVYYIATALAAALAAQFLPFVDYGQTQETGFAAIATTPEYIIAFISLVVVAPIAEEVLFRGYLFGKLRKYAPLWLSILITSVLFGIVHFQWNVGIDVFVLSIVLCLLRVTTGSIWPSILLHMTKNGIAYYFLFINPAILSTLGG